MITRLVIENFKSLRKVDLTLGRVNLFIGTNASGKSNFLEALRVLQGIANGFTISEVLNGKPRSTTSEVWEGIRGGSAHACFTGADEGREVRIEVHGRLEEAPLHTWLYQIALLPVEGVVSAESYTLDETGSEITSPTLPRHSYSNDFSTVGLRANSMLTEGYHDDDDPVIQIISSLANAQRIDLAPDVLRSYSQADRAQRMGERGENFAALVKTICENEATKDAYLSWLRQLRPEEIDDVGTLSGAVGEPMFMLQEGGQTFPAPVLSDGTLRFAALAAAFFQPGMPRIMTIEEVENGIHASRLQLLLELLRSQAAASHTQVIATTHSATVLDWLQKDEYKTTFFCQRDEATSESYIRALADIPHFLDAVEKTPVSELFAEGWLETAA